MSKKIKVYSIDQDIPVPERARGEVGSVPLDLLGVGESVLFSEEIRSGVQSTASKLKKNKGKEFTVRNVGSGNCRVWRTK